MERLPQHSIQSVMGGWKKGYIDTPWFYVKGDIIRFMKNNMSPTDYNKLKKWYINNSEKVKKIMKL